MRLLERAPLLPPRMATMCRSTDTLEPVTGTLRLSNGFAWWLPLITAAAAVLIAVGVSQASAAAWDADIHLWAREGKTASEYAELLLDPVVQEAATAGMMATERGAPALMDVDVEVNDTLIRVTVRASHGTDAEALAISLAHAAVNESIIQDGLATGLDVLGLVRPGARQVSPSTARSAAWASAIGLAGGLALAWLAARRTTSPTTTLGRLGRLGLRPIAVISADAERAAARSARSASCTANGAPLPAASVGTASTSTSESSADDAAALADAIESRSGVIALVPLDDVSVVTATLTQAARNLAARGKSVVWLDARRPAFDLVYTAPPRCLAGTAWSAVPRWELIVRAATRARRPNGAVLLLTDSLADPATVGVAQAAEGVILMVSAEASDAQLAHARLLLSGAPLVGVALTQAQAPDLRDFELAQMSE